MALKRTELKTSWMSAIEENSFLTEKHDPASVGTPYPDYRTVSVRDEDGLKEFIKGDEYKVIQYENTNPNHSKDYFRIIPNDTSMVAGSGVMPHSMGCSHPCDNYVVVSGEAQGWHLFAEESSKINEKSDNGDLNFMTELM